MSVRVATEIPGVDVIVPTMHRDYRGWFMESYRSMDFPEVSFCQDNVSFSNAGTLRGLHYQVAPNAMGKLVRVVSGSVFDVAVDVYDGRWVGRVLDSENGHALWVPAGFAHGFLALTDAVVMYKCTTVYSPESERCLAWNCPKIGIDWPQMPVFISQKDQEAPGL